MASQAAAAILAGIPAMQNAATMRANTGAIYGEGLANVGKQIGGILQAQSQKKVEDDYATVDNAFQSAIAAGKPEEMTRVLTAVAPTLKTPKGKAYLAEKMGKTFGIRSDMLDIEAKKARLEREKKAPVRAGILFKAQKGDDTALSDASALADEEFQKEVGGALAVAKAGARAAADQTIQETDRAEKKRIDTMGTKAANELAVLIQSNPSLADKPWTLSKMMTESGKYDLAVQKDAMAKVAVFFGLDQKVQASEAAAKKARISNWQTEASKTGRTVKFGPDGEPVMGPDGNPVTVEDVGSKRWQQEQEDKKKMFALRTETVALARSAEARAAAKAAKGDREGALADKKDALGAVSKAIHDSLDQYGGLIPGASREDVDLYQKEEARLTKEIVEMEKGGGGEKKDATAEALKDALRKALGK